MAEFQFLYPMWLLAAIPALVFAGWLFNQTHGTSLIAPHLTKQLGLDQRPTRRLAIILTTIAWLIAIIALASPSFEKQAVPTFSVSHARVIVMDMSQSMYATDLKPDRLTQAKYKTLDLLKELEEGTTGLVAYSRGAYMISPLTTDTETIANLVPDLSPSIMPKKGNNAVSGVEKAIDMLTQAGETKGDILLMSDEVTPSQAEQIKDLLNGTKWHLLVMSIGTKDGAPFKQENGGMFAQNGKIVIAKTNVQAMKDFANSTGGTFTQLTSDNKDIQTLLTAMNKIHNEAVQQKNDISGIEIRINNGYWLLPLLLIFALASFRKGGIFSLLLIMSVPFMQPNNAYAEDNVPPAASSKLSLSSVFKTPDQQGYSDYQDKDYLNAASKFENKAWQGAAKYQARDYQGAIEALKGLNDEDSRYNLANAQAQSGQLEQAIDTYESILKQNPNHVDAKKNLEIVKKAQEQQKQQQQNQQNQQNGDNQGQKNQQNGNNQGQNNQNQGKKNQQNGNNQGQNNQNQGQKNQQNSSNQGQNNQNQGQKSQQNGSNQGQDKQNQDQQNGGQHGQEKNGQGKHGQRVAVGKADPNGDAPVGNTIAVDPSQQKLEQIPDNLKNLLQAQMQYEASQASTAQGSEKTW